MRGRRWGKGEKGKRGEVMRHVLRVGHAGLWNTCPNPAGHNVRSFPLHFPLPPPLRCGCCRGASVQAAGEGIAPLFEPCLTN